VFHELCLEEATWSLVGTLVKDRHETAVKDDLGLDAPMDTDTDLPIQVDNS